MLPQRSPHELTFLRLQHKIRKQGTSSFEKAMATKTQRGDMRQFALGIYDFLYVALAAIVFCLPLSVFLYRFLQMYVCLLSISALFRLTMITKPRNIQ